MKAIVFDGHTMRYVHDHPRPETQPGWARIQVRLAGICKTDLEIIRGYMGFTGVLGHEFIGLVKDCEDPSWIGRRVAGEINAACGHCPWCDAGLGRHCPDRKTLGIDRLDGCMAEFCLLPVENLLEIPDSVSDDRAVLMEPLAAACEILEQISLTGDEKIIVLGDGRLGILCAWALSTVCPDLTLVGRHPAKLDLARWRNIRTVSRPKDISRPADIVIEATGSGQGLVQAMDICRPRGTIVLKSTLADQGNLNLAPLVIKEVTLIGSRCGRFEHALSMMTECKDMPLERLISGRFPLHQAQEAFARAADGSALKILFQIKE